MQVLLACGSYKPSCFLSSVPIAFPGDSLTGLRRITTAQAFLNSISRDVKLSASASANNTPTALRILSVVSMTDVREMPFQGRVTQHTAGVEAMQGCYLLTRSSNGLLSLLLYRTHDHLAWDDITLNGLPLPNRSLVKEMTYRLAFFLCAKFVLVPGEGFQCTEGKMVSLGNWLEASG